MVLSRKDQKQPVQVAKYVPKLSEAKRLEIEQKKKYYAPSCKLDGKGRGDF